MPKITPAHERQIRDRIVRAALRVFAGRGFHHATMQDVVRESGLSVGAIYTYFAGKDELFLAGCDLTADLGLGELGDRLARGRTVVERLATAVGFFFDTMESSVEGLGTASFLVQAWAEADREPAVREMLVRRREQLVTVGQMLLREAIARGEAPAWLDVDATARAYSALLDGLLLQRMEQGSGWRRDEAERRAYALLELLFASAGAAARPTVQRPATEPYSIVAPAAAAPGRRVS